MVIGIIFELLPLLEEEVLRHLVIQQLILKSRRIFLAFLTTTLVLARPFPKCPQTKCLLERHKLRIRLKPFFLFCTKCLEIRRGIRRKPHKGSLQKATVAHKKRAVINAGGIRAKIQIVKVMLCQISEFFQRVKINEIGITCSSRKRLVGRITIAGSCQWQYLPIALFCTGEKIDKPIRLLAKGANSIRIGKR